MHASMTTRPPGFTILGSGSSGNCALLQAGDTCILIDAGFSARRILELLKSVGRTIESVHAVFLTHEHQDHAQGFRGLGKFPHLTWIANRETYDALPHAGREKARWSLFETGARFRFRDLEVETFPIPHDAVDPVGYFFQWGGDDLFHPHDSLAWLLDLGHVTSLVRERVCRARTLVVEANYDRELLEGDLKRPWSVKQRIQSRHGHLSNEAVLDLLQNTAFERLGEVHLAHISRDCNSAAAIRKVFAPLLAPGCSYVLRWFNAETGQSELL
jgi:phosphoribosyl 1,2-cyclic phosphodiesterase